MVIFLGRHLSLGPKSLLGLIETALFYKTNALAFFLGNPYSFKRPNFTDLQIETFNQKIKDVNWSQDKILVHAPYIINLSNVDNDIVFNNSIDILSKDMSTMEKVGLNSIVIHPGSIMKSNLTLAITRLVKGLKILLTKHPKIKIILECMSSNKNICGSFEHFSQIFKELEQLSENVGVCWDTSHLYVAGYDIKNKLLEVVKEFDNLIGLKKLWAIHVNDSFYDINTCRDKHVNIGKGKIGSFALKKIVNFPLFENIPKILETPFIDINSCEEELKQLIY